MLEVDDGDIQVIDATTEHKVDRHPCPFLLKNSAGTKGGPGTNPQSMSEEDVLETVCYGAFGSLAKNE